MMNPPSTNKANQINKQILKINSKIKNLNKQLQTVPTTKQWEECLLGIERIAYKYSQISTHPPISYNSQTILTPIHELWLLVQHALQSGPFINSKPAYFKRAHIHFIKRAYTFIDNIKSYDLSFTETQNNRLTKWLMNAKKSAESQNQRKETPSINLQHSTTSHSTTSSTPIYIEKVGNKKKIPKAKLIKKYRQAKKQNKNKQTPK